MEENKMTPAVPAAETKPEVKHLTKEQLDELKKQGIDLTPEEVEQLESLIASGIKIEKISEGDELNVSGGVNISPKMKKALYIAGAVVGVGALGFGGYEGYKHKDKISGFLKSKFGKSETDED